MPSFTSMLQLANLRSEEIFRKVPEAICCCGCHGNSIMHGPSFTSMRATVSKFEE